MQAAKGLSVHI